MGGLVGGLVGVCGWVGVWVGADVCRGVRMGVGPWHSWPELGCRAGGLHLLARRAQVSPS